jgi:pimeloyl-ACP methyl ester carboxylesterase
MSGRGVGHYGVPAAHLRGDPMSDVLLPGITATRVTTPRLAQNVLHPEGVDPAGPGEVVLFVHGNVSSSLFWQQPLLALAEVGRVRPLAVDLRGYGDTDPLPIDARRGVRDWADDVAALVETLDLERVHLVGWSMGAGVVLQYLIDHPRRVASVVLVAPVSPYGFGGTAGAEGRRLSDDGAGAGAGAANPAFVAALAAGDTSADEPTSPRSILRAFYVAPGSLPLDPQLEDVFVASMNSTRTGVDHYPGDTATCETWPGVRPGTRGVLNTMAPTVFDVSRIVDLPQKPPVLWVRGDADQIVSDTSAFDLAFLGSLGAVPGWPGEEVCPPQPMVTQTRAVLDRYAATGGAYREVVLPDVGHSPHVERPQEFVVALLEHLDTPAESPAYLT